MTVAFNSLIGGRYQFYLFTYLLFCLFFNLPFHLNVCTLLKNHLSKYSLQKCSLKTNMVRNTRRFFSVLEFMLSFEKRNTHNSSSAVPCSSELILLFPRLLVFNIFFQQDHLSQHIKKPYFQQRESSSWGNVHFISFCNILKNKKMKFLL